MHAHDETLILHYYGELAAPEEADVTRHLEACQACRTEYARLQRVLAVVDSVPVPERAPDYEDAVWAAVARRLPARQRPWWAFAWSPSRLALAASLAMLVVAAFVAGRFYPAGGPAGGTADDPRERILLVAVGDHLEQTQMVLVELVNAEGGGTTGDTVDISAAREQAADLVSDNRIYRQTAEGAGDARIAEVLDELERVLIEVARSPERVSREDLQTIVDSIDAEGLLFRVRVVGQEVREREEAVVAPLGRAVS